MLKIILKHNLIELAIITAFEKLERNFKIPSSNEYKYYLDYVNSLVMSIHNNKNKFDISTINAFYRMYALVDSYNKVCTSVNLNELEYFKRQLDRCLEVDRYAKDHTKT